MKIKITLWVILCCTFYVLSQDSISIKVRDIDQTRFQKIKLYVNVLDKDGKSVTNLDSSKFIINENATGKKSIPNVINFYKSSEPLAILFSMDASLSMTGKPLSNVKEGLLKILAEFRANDKLGIAYFHDDFYKQASFDIDREVLRNNINNLNAGGTTTELFKGTIESIKWLKSLPEPRRKVLILISDGDDNGKSTFKLEDAINEIKGSDISVYTIGSTAQDNGFLVNMEKLAGSANDGKYYKITSPEDIKNIIPAIYSRIKEEYILTYFSYAEPSVKMEANLELSLNNKTFTVPFRYDAPSVIVENAPGVSFFKTKEFLYGSIGTGIVILTLAVFMFINIQKKKQFREEKELERKAREEESMMYEEKFSTIQREYESLLDSLENQKNISDTEKKKIEELEQQLQITGKTLYGEPYKVDMKRRTMILEKGSQIPGYQTSHISNVVSLIVRSGYSSGKQYNLVNPSYVIGRMNSDIIISDDIVSRQHARISKMNSHFFIEDLNSTNGTFVNNNRINRATLNNGDIIRLGTVELTFNVF